MSTYSSWRSDQGNMRALSDELAAQAAMARSREASLHRRLRSLEGDLSSRVEVLTRLVNALIELGEVREELGCRVSGVAVLPGRVALVWPLVLRVVVADLAEGEPVPHEHDAVRWLAADQLDEVAWLEADRPFLDTVRGWLR